MSEERLKIAVFIDFDNIEIGVKKTLSRHFDIGTVLEAIKERGEVVTKIAYGDWKHASDYSRAMTQHAVHMVQRNLTPGGDKNGADITLALDALEMAFTRSHINAFVIVGGDSDFIALVEKLKQYDKMVFVVGGRSFTSSILQKNCHEFIAYENLIHVPVVARKAAGKTAAVSTAQLDDALPPLRRALEILADREVSPQLGLLKSTLLQLDSTFSERDYGVHSFREFIQKMANAGFVNLKQVDRSLLVELKDGEGTNAQASVPVSAAPETEPEAPPTPSREATAPPPQAEAAVQAIRKIMEQVGSRAHWPMYLRSFKHFLRATDPSFDERRFGFGNIHDLARQVQREGLIRIERNRQGILRIFPGEQFPTSLPESAADEDLAPAADAASVIIEKATESLPSITEPAMDIVPELPGEGPLQEISSEDSPEAADVPAPQKTRRKRPTGERGAAKPRRAVPRKPRAAKKVTANP